MQHLDVADPPSSAPSQRSSARRCIAHFASTNSCSVPRSDRNRRVATRAWCRASGSRSVHSTGSLVSKRATDDRERDAHDVADAQSRGLGHDQPSTLRALVRAMASSCSATCASRPRTFGTFTQVPSGSRRHASTSSAKFRSRISSSRARRRVVGDAQHRLDAPIEVARHHVGRSDHVLGLVVAGLAESEDPRVLEIAADDRAHRDPLRKPGHAGAQAADAAHDEVDARAGVGRRVELVDHLGVDEGVHLHRDARRPAAPGRGSAGPSASRRCVGATSSLRVFALDGCNR